MENSEFFLTDGFSLVASDTSEYFGDCYDIYKKRNTYIRVAKDKSAIFVDVSNDGENWYDLDLIKVLLHKETNLIHTSTIEEHLDFLKKQTDNIVELFDDENYSTTKIKLEHLANERAKRMFPLFL